MPRSPMSTDGRSPRPVWCWGRGRNLRGKDSIERPTPASSQLIEQPTRTFRGRGSRLVFILARSWRPVTRPVRHPFRRLDPLRRVKRGENSLGIVRALTSLRRLFTRGAEASRSVLSFAGYYMEFVQSVVVEGDGLSSAEAVVEVQSKLLYVWIHGRRLGAGDATLESGVDR